MYTSIQEIITYVENKSGSNLSLDRISQALNELGNPQNKYKTIHIAGTNGKGSTTNYLRAILQNAGYQVGTYTSPYLESFNDRIRINDQFISDEDVLYYMNHYHYLFEKHNLTFFEILTVLAFIYFAEQKVDIAVIEVGLGGRLDATNVILPICSAITNISYDHMIELGDTLEKIAFEKGGIIKANTPIFSTIEQSNALDVIYEIALSKNAPIQLVNPYKEIPYTIKSTAKYQMKNINLVLSMIPYLIQKGFNIQEEHIEKALSETIWKGRFETIVENPTIIIDGAHNIGGIEQLKESIENQFKDPSKVHILFTALKDKEVTEMIQILNTVTSNVYLTTFDFYRASTLEQLAIHPHKKAFRNFEHAYIDLVSQLKSDEVLIITGSLYFISEVRKYIVDLKQKEQ